MVIDLCVLRPGLFIIFECVRVYLLFLSALSSFNYSLSPVTRARRSGWTLLEIRESTWVSTDGVCSRDLGWIPVISGSRQIGLKCVELTVKLRLKLRLRSLCDVKCLGGSGTVFYVRIWAHSTRTSLPLLFLDKSAEDKTYF
jgi:hypothetical protein